MKKEYRLLGIAWYRPEQYEMMRALSVDADKMATTYEAWLANVNKTVVDMRRAGMVGRRVDVELGELIAWCSQRGLPLDGAARSTYAAENIDTKALD